MFFKTKEISMRTCFIGLMLLRPAFDMGFLVFALPRYPKYFSLNFNIFSYLYSWILYIILSYKSLYLVKSDDIVFSKLVTFLLFIACYVPVSTLNGLCFNDFWFTTLQFIFWFIILYLIKRYNKEKKISFRKEKHVQNINSNLLFEKNSSKMLLHLGTAFSFILVIWMVYSINRFNFNFSFDRIYELREIKSSSLNTTTGLIVSIMPTIFIPIIASICLKHKKVLLFILCCLLQLCLFMLGGDKFFLFVFLLGLIFYKILSMKFLRLLPLLFFSILLISNLLICFTEGSFFERWIYDLGIRRAFFTPAMLSNFFYEYFKLNPKLWYTDHPVVLRILVKIFGVDLFYKDDVADYVGKYFWDATGANNGTFGNAFSEFGYLGIIVYPIIFLIIVKIIDNITKDIDPKLYAILSIAFVVALQNTSIAGIELIYVLFSFILFTLYKKAYGNYY